MNQFILFLGYLIAAPLFLTLDVVTPELLPLTVRTVIDDVVSNVVAANQETLSPTDQFVIMYKIQFGIAQVRGTFSSIALYSATTWIPTILFVILIAVTTIAKPAINIGRVLTHYVTSSIIEKDEVPLFSIIGAFLGLLVLLVRIFAII